MRRAIEWEELHAAATVQKKEIGCHIYCEEYTKQRAELDKENEAYHRAQQKKMDVLGVRNPNK